ncbi:hypothetical protein HPB48_006335 [Haemaphysalis longicornis]|uniref:BEN domain-containing protein n=1 Tax=Haemaphysalis longicornis TaxID=44386 RepID=A0A9J6GXV5_HAELO|nr:hypothetical protein HPB48_006335 [Haemaphysalis longicornis]
MIEELDEAPYDDRGSGAAAVPVSSDFECPWPQGPTGRGAAAVPPTILAERPEARGLAATYMNVDKFAFIMRSTSDARCVLDVSRHLWLEEEAAQRSLTGQAPRTILGASGKCVATPEKVDIVKNFLAKYIAEHPRPGGPPAEHRLGQVRKHLRSFFTESSRRGKRGTQKKIKPMSKHWLFCIHCKKLTVMRSGCVFV